MKIKATPVKKDKANITLTIKLDYPALIADLEKLIAIVKKLNQPSKKR